MKPGLRSGDWFGCGQKITTESWANFLRARAEYYAKLDAKQAEEVAKAKALLTPKPSEAESFIPCREVAN